MWKNSQMGCKKNNCWWKVKYLKIKSCGNSGEKGGRISPVNKFLPDTDLIHNHSFEHLFTSI